MTREEAKAEINKEFEPAFANYIITALTDGATPSERKTGKWIKDKYGTDHCSCCNYIPAYDTAIDDIYYSPYCPNCGVKMEVDE